MKLNDIAVCKLLLGEKKNGFDAKLSICYVTRELSFSKISEDGKLPHIFIKSECILYYNQHPKNVYGTEMNRFDELNLFLISEYTRINLLA